MASSNSNKTTVVLALCNAPDKKTAQTIARQLVRGKTAACVNILTPCRSVYMWGGEKIEETETPVLIKTTAAKIPELKKTVKQLHPYEEPELVIWRAEDGLPGYLKWVAEECGG